MHDYIFLLEQYKVVVDESNIVSKTDKKGIITYANKKFIEISGYNESELIGKNHNIIRHPDMPSNAFQDLWNYFIKDADFGIDLHSASYNRWNYPHIRGDMRNAKIREIAKNFSAPITLHSRGVKGSLRREATLRGIPFVLFEAGQINRFEKDVVRIGTSGVLSALYGSGMLDEWPAEEITHPPDSAEYFSKSQWVRANNGGLFTPAILPGDFIETDTTLGTISSIHGETISTVKSPCEGRILGFNLHPQVIPGRALFNIGYEPRHL